MLKNDGHRKHIYKTYSKFEQRIMRQNGKKDKNEKSSEIEISFTL